MLYKFSCSINAFIYVENSPSQNVAILSNISEIFIFSTCYVFMIIKIHLQCGCTF